MKFAERTLVERDSAQLPAPARCSITAFLKHIGAAF